MKPIVIIAAVLLAGCQTLPKDGLLMGDAYREFSGHPRYSMCIKRAKRASDISGYQIQRVHGKPYSHDLTYKSPYTIFYGCLRRG